MISYLPLLQGSNLSVPHSKDLVWYFEIYDFRSKDPDWRSWTHTSYSLIYVDNLSPSLPRKVQFISQKFKIAHKFQFFIMYLLSFHYFISFWAHLTISDMEQYKRLWAQGFCASSLPLHYIYFLGFYLVMKGVMDLPFVIVARILLYH